MLLHLTNISNFAGTAIGLEHSRVEGEGEYGGQDEDMFNLRQENDELRLSLEKAHKGARLCTHTQTHTHTHVCVCVCVCVLPRCCVRISIVKIRVVGGCRSA